MPNITAIIGKTCAGKTTYAKTLPGILLSSDDFMLPLFGQHCEQIHKHLPIVQDCLLELALQILSKDIDIILDLGFWLCAERQRVATFFAAHGMAVQWVYIDIPKELQLRQIAKRNAEIEQGLKAYHVSPALAQACDDMFEEPEEIDGLFRV